MIQKDKNLNIPFLEQKKIYLLGNLCADLARFIPALHSGHFLALLLGDVVALHGRHFNALLLAVHLAAHLLVHKSALPTTKITLIFKPESFFI